MTVVITHSNETCFSKIPETPPLPFHLFPANPFRTDTKFMPSSRGRLNCLIFRQEASSQLDGKGRGLYSRLPIKIGNCSKNRQFGRSFGRMGMEQKNNE
jgi:hypothetical protein